MSDAPDPRKLEELEKRINSLRKVTEPEKPKADDHFSQAELGWRMVIELVAGLLIGFGIGYGLDRLFGTLPIFLILFVLMGFAAGVKTMLRTATEAQEKNDGASASEDERT